MRSTHTFAQLAVSPAVYDEIAAKLKDAGYDHAFIDGTIDMHGIGLVRQETIDWGKAEEYLRKTREAYAAIGLAGIPATRIVLDPLTLRFERHGERTRELYDEIMALE